MYTPTKVTTIDGHTCLSDSEEWRLYCEVMTIFRRTQEDRQFHMERIAKMRGKVGHDALEAEMNRLEPHYLLSMATREMRRSYLSQVERYRSRVARDRLEQRIVELWEAKKRVAEATNVT